MINVNIISFYHRLEEYDTKFSLASLRLGMKNVEDRDIKTKILPFRLEESEENIVKKLISEKSDIVALSSYIWTSKKVKKINSILYEKAPNTLVIIGGPDTKNINENKYPNNSIVVNGEGEKEFREICKIKNENKNYNANKIISLKEKTEPISEEIEGVHPLFSKEMDKIIIQKDYPKKFTWYETTRGCPYKCGYCGHKTREGIGKFTDEVVKKEIQNIGKRGIEEIFIVDPILGGTPKRGKHIIQLFRQYAPETKLIFYLRPEYLDEEYIDIMSRTNIKELRIGIQSLNKKIPNWIRSNNIKKIYEILPELSKEKINWRAELITGLPGDNLGGVKKSIEEVVDKLKPKSIYSYHLTVIEGTKLNDIVNSDLIPHINVDENTKKSISSSSYSAQDMENMLIFSTASTSLYNLHSDSGIKISFKNIEDIIKKEKNSIEEKNTRQIFISTDMNSAKEYWMSKKK